MSHLIKSYSKLIPKYAHGSWVKTKCGRSILDMTSGIGALSLGHTHPEIVKALRYQLNRMAFSQQNCWKNPLASEFINEMNSLTISPWNGYFLTNSGSEAVDQTLKFYMKYQNRSKIISLKDGFHGRTIGASGVSTSIEQSHYPQSFSNIIDINQIENVDFADKSIACVIMETLQGEGGLRELPSDKIQHIREQTAHYEIPLVIDEVQSGSGRTGYWFHHEKYKFQPDAVIFGKALGNGMPIAGVLFKQRYEINDFIKKGFFGGTYNGNLLALKSSIECMKIVKKENLLEQNKINGEKIKQGLKSLGIEKVYGNGLMLGFEVPNYPSPMLQEQLLTHNILVLTAGYDKLIRLLPSYVINDFEIHYFLEKLKRIIEIHHENSFV